MNVCLMGIPEREDVKKEAERIFEEIIDENFPSLMKKINL